MEYQLEFVLFCNCGTELGVKICRNAVRNMRRTWERNFVDNLVQLVDFYSSSWWNLILKLADFLFCFDQGAFKHKWEELLFQRNTTRRKLKLCCIALDVVFQCAARDNWWSNKHEQPIKRSRINKQDLYPRIWVWTRSSLVWTRQCRSRAVVRKGVHRVSHLGNFILFTRMCRFPEQKSSLRIGYMNPGYERSQARLYTPIQDAPENSNQKHSWFNSPQGETSDKNLDNL